MYSTKGSDHLHFNKQTFVGLTEGLLINEYDILKQIGKGAYGKVFKVKNKTTGEIRACKQLVKHDISNIVKFQREITILKKADHPNIIKLYEVYEDDRFIYLVMEQCKGGELFDRIITHIQKKKMYTEKDACQIFLQLMSSISYCHNNGICHRDLKPENILYYFEGDEINNPIKVIDFGLSRNFEKKSKMNTKVGTAYYVAPEVLSGIYNEKCDIWSAGVILYILLSGEPPFNGPNDHEIYKKIKKMKFNFPNERWEKITKEAIDLIKKCISPEESRLSAQEVLNHPWFNIINKVNCVNLDFDIETFVKYVNSNKLKKMVLTFIAARINDDEVKHLKDIFKAFDSNNDGTISYVELEEGIKKLHCKNISDNDIETIFTSLDTDRSGSIDYTQFLAASLDEKIYLTENRLYEAFLAIDKDGSGKIGKNEIKNILNSENDEKIDELIKKIDKNGDGEIDYNEFLDMMGFNQVMECDC